MSVWTVVSFQNSNWSAGGMPDDSAYEECDFYRVAANTAKEAKRKAQAQAQRQRDNRKTS